MISAAHYIANDTRKHWRSAPPSQPSKRAARHSPRNTLSAIEAKMAKRDHVVLDHLSLVRGIAIRVREKLAVNVEVDDLIHSGILGLIDAAARFDPEKQVAFSAYAKHRIRGSILDSLRDADWASRDLRRRQKLLQTAAHSLTGELNRTPTELEIAERLGMDIARCRQVIAHVRTCGLMSSDTKPQREDDTRAIELVDEATARPDRLYADSQRRDLINTAMTGLPERYKLVVSMYYDREMTMKDIGTELGINESRVSQIHKAALEKMNVAMKEAGVRHISEV